MDRRRRHHGSGRGALARGLLVAAALGLVAGPARAKPKRASKAEVEAAGLDDPRARELPTRHRIRLALHADWVRLSAATSINGQGVQKTTRFHYAPLYLDFAYQVQFLRYLMLRPGIAIGGNVANTRNAMPAAFKPSLFGGFQGKLLGVAIGYTYTLPFPATKDATDNTSKPGQPVIWNQHSFDGEVSLTTRIDRGALTFAVRLGALNANLLHYDIDRYRWFFRLGLTAGWFWDVGKKRRSRARARSNAT